MRKFKLRNRTTIPYIIAFILGLLLLPIAVKAAYIQRGYQAIGGELLIPLLAIMVITLVREVKATFKEGGS